MTISHQILPTNFLRSCCLNAFFTSTGFGINITFNFYFKISDTEAHISRLEEMGHGLQKLPHTVDIIDQIVELIGLCCCVLSNK